MTRAAAAAAFVGEAAAAAIVRETLPGGLLADVAASGVGVRRTRCCSGGVGDNATSGGVESRDRIRIRTVRSSVSSQVVQVGAG